MCLKTKRVFLRPGSTAHCIYSFAPPQNLGQKPGQKSWAGIINRRWRLMMIMMGWDEDVEIDSRSDDEDNEQYCRTTTAADSYDDEYDFDDEDENGKANDNNHEEENDDEKDDDDDDNADDDWCLVCYHNHWYGCDCFFLFCCCRSYKGKPMKNKWKNKNNTENHDIGFVVRYIYLFFPIFS